MLLCWVGCHAHLLQGGGCGCGCHIAMVVTHCRCVGWVATLTLVVGSLPFLCSGGGGCSSLLLSGGGGW